MGHRPFRDAYSRRTSPDITDPPLFMANRGLAAILMLLVLIILVLTKMQLPKAALFLGDQSVEFWFLRRWRHSSGTSAVSHAFGPAITYNISYYRICFKSLHAMINVTTFNNFYYCTSRIHNDPLGVINIVLQGSARNQLGTFDSLLRSECSRKRKGARLHRHHEATILCNLPPEAIS